MKRSNTTSGLISVMAVAIALAVSVVVFTDMNSPVQQPSGELPNHVDSFESVQIADEQVPLADQDVTTDTKTTKKTVKLKKKAAKTYTKKLPAKVKTSTDVKETDSSRIETKTTVKTTTKEQYKKKKKTKTVIKTVTTTVVTTTYDLETANANQQVQAAPEPAEAAAAEPVQDAGQDINLTDISGIRTAAPMADENVLSAFEQLGFKFKVDKGYAYTGYFGAKDRCIILRKKDDNVYHELGHFVAFAAGGVDTGSAFKEIYKEEKSLYDGRNPAYVLSNSEEYFAESYRDYVLDSAALQTERPKTFEAVDSAVAKITAKQVTKLKTVYASIWK